MVEIYYTKYILLFEQTHGINVKKFGSNPFTIIFITFYAFQRAKKVALFSLELKPMFNGMLGKNHEIMQNHRILNTSE